MINVSWNNFVLLHDVILILEKHYRFIFYLKGNSVTSMDLFVFKHPKANRFLVAPCGL